VLTTSPAPLIEFRSSLFQAKAVEFAFNSPATNDSWLRDQERSLPDPSSHPESLSVALSKLKSLHRDADGVADVVAIGECAIPALKIILLERESSGLYQVRCRAVEALGLLGAFDVLAEFLRERKPADDPVERLGDDVVISSAARAIALRKDERTFSLLYELAPRRQLNGLIAALASFRRLEAIPVLIGALGEDEVRLAAKTALVSFGWVTRPFLLEAADQLNSIDDLSESQLRKFQSILSLLGDIDLDSADVELLRPFMMNEWHCA
jgi:hypothetical protein